jgi:hypothetical protein
VAQVIIAKTGLSTPSGEFVGDLGTKYRPDVRLALIDNGFERCRRSSQSGPVFLGRSRPLLSINWFIFPTAPVFLSGSLHAERPSNKCCACSFADLSTTARATRRTDGRMATYPTWIKLRKNSAEDPVGHFLECVKRDSGWQQNLP